MVDTPAFLQRVYSHRSLSFCTCLLIFVCGLCCTYARFFPGGLVHPPGCCNDYSEICIGMRLTGSCLLGRGRLWFIFSLLSFSFVWDEHLCGSFFFPEEYIPGDGMVP